MRLLKIIGHSFFAQLAPVMRAWITFTLATLLPVPMFFGLGQGEDATVKASLAFGYVVMSVMNAALTQVALTVNADRTFAWDGWVRTLPAPAWPRLLGRTLGVYVVALVSTIPIVTLGAMTQTSPLAYVLRCLGITLVTALLFGAIGAILGLLARPESVQNAAAAIFFVFAMLGGVFTGGIRYSWVPKWIFDWLPSTISIQVIMSPTLFTVGRAVALLVVLLGTVGLVSRYSNALKYD
ncbi:hypothetical protein [Boudabousia marimammalium]|uniref:Uncharacterized protein n=1 Tax=Boudabousia marimammalium TaxID=156892 RepID=A0A1Q5PJ71_9ACTO|nr:hypothetical protein [Boudabousia marimammalium]OKL45906.1 hypothetical protein BM477_07830 [Boudabousia marimammalium]